MNPKKWLSGLFVFALLAFMGGCGMSTPPNQIQAQTGSVFVTGMDAPLPSVVSFQVDITGLSVSDGTNPPGTRCDE